MWTNVKINLILKKWVTQFCLTGRGKVNHKGRNRHFITEAEIEAEREKERKDRAWRVRQNTRCLSYLCLFQHCLTIYVYICNFQQRQGDEEDDAEEEDSEKEEQESEEESDSDEEVC